MSAEGLRGAVGIASALRRRWLGLAGNSIAAALLAVIVVRMLPADYVAETSILFDGATEGLASFDLSQLSDILPNGLGGGQGRRENIHAYVPIVESRSLLTRVLQARDPSDSTRTIFVRFAPTGGSDQRKWETAVKRARDAVKAGLDSKPGVLRISVRDRDSRTAAGVANLLVAEVQRFNRESRMSRAADATDFIEARLTEAKLSLAGAEDALAAFRSRNARIGNAPGLVLQERRLTRSVEVEEQTYLLLARQLELARIQEKREGPVFSVIDSAVPPTRPSRFPYTVVALIAALIAGSAYVLVITGIRGLGWNPKDER